MSKYKEEEETNIRYNTEQSTPSIGAKAPHERG